VKDRSILKELLAGGTLFESVLIFRVAVDFRRVGQLAAASDSTHTFEQISTVRNVKNVPRGTFLSGGISAATADARPLTEN